MRVDAACGQPVNAHGAEENKLLNARGLRCLRGLHGQHMVDRVVFRRSLRRFPAMGQPRDQNDRVKDGQVKPSPSIAAEA